jgi:hypothetical protein
MHIYVFAILKCRKLKKNKKTENTVEALPCVCTRQRTIWSLCHAHTHGKASTWRTPVQPGSWLVCCLWPLPCELAPGRTAKPPGRRTAKNQHDKPSTHGKASRTHGNGPCHGNDQSARQRMTHDKVAMRMATLARHDKGLCRAYMVERTAKIALSFVTLPWALCRGSTHGKGVAVSLLPFAMRAPHTATIVFPVVGSLPRAIGRRSP